jgi:hypothetical protein
MGKHINPTDVEVFFDKDDIIVCKTDRKGRITCANQVFCDVSGCSEAELLGPPHNLICPGRRILETAIIPLCAAVLAEERRRRKRQAALAAVLALPLDHEIEEHEL